MSSIPINLCGTVATAPQSKVLPSGRACASFRLAVNHWKLDKATGEYTQDSTSWFGIDCYGPLASNAAMSITPGMAIIIQGGLKIREWTAEGKTGLAPTVIAEHVGPDLRFGTANYQKVGGGRQQASSHQSGSESADAASASGWGAFGTSGPTQTTEAAEPGEYSLDSSPGDTGRDVTGNDLSSDDTGRADIEDTGSEETELESNDDAIARDTAAVAAPF